MSELIKRLRSMRSCTVCEGDGVKTNGKQCGGCNGAGEVPRYDRTGVEAAEEIERLWAGIKRLSDEEEYCAEVTGDDPYSMVYLAAKLSAVENRLAEVGASIAERNDHTGLTMLLQSKADTIRTEYQLAYGRPCDCRTSESALQYGRAQGLEIAADIIGADPSPHPREVVR